MADGTLKSKERVLTALELREGRDLLGVLDRHLEMLRAQTLRTYGEYLDKFSRNGAFICSSDENGIIRMDTDATFIAEQIAVYDSWEDEPEYAIGTNFQLQIEDLSSGRNLTESQVPEFAAETSVATVPALAIPSVMWVPVQPGNVMRRVINMDYLAKFPVEFEVPRGGTLRFSFVPITSQRGSITPFQQTPAVVFPVVLIGYKIYN